MAFDLDDTIAAIASAPGGAMRGILRVTGPDTLRVVERCFHPQCRFAWREQKSAVAVEGEFDLGASLGTMPADLYLWPDARSYTRQPSAELHTIGSPPLLQAALRTILSAGARLAQPGEFTLRAFLAGRIDLTQAEAVLGVIDARSGRELDVALGQLAGGLASPLNELRDGLLDLLAHLEAGLDFVDEDIEFISAEELDGRLRHAREQIARIVAQTVSRSLTQWTYPVVLRGLPNAGKSSLLNALCGRDIALVSEVAGTTRDYVAQTMTIDGIECLLVDTAGVDSAADDAIQAAAQQAAVRQHQQSRLALLCIDGGRPLDPWEQEQLADGSENQIVVQTKCDIAPPRELAGSVLVSSRTGRGLDTLRAEMRRRIERLWHQDSSIVADTAVRCGESLQSASQSLARARDAAAHGWGEEFVAAEVRGALDDLGRVVGAVYTDDVLDRIFSRFCIGK